MMAIVPLFCAAIVAVSSLPVPWYQGIDSITVLSPTNDPDATANLVKKIWTDMEEDAHGNASAFQKGQFGNKRRAILLTPGDYGDLVIPVNWYTSVIGAGLSAADVTVSGISSVDAYPGSSKGSLENFWKSVEGLTTTQKSTLWAVSQAAPLRRSNIQGDLWLSETNENQGSQGGAHYTSGGYMADVKVGGTLHWGTQQQFFFRNSEFANVNYTASGKSFVFVGVEGSPQYNTDQPSPLISNIDAAPTVAEKPYIVQLNDTWHIAVPNKETQKRGASSGSSIPMIPMEDVFIAKEGDDADAIQAGIQGKAALLLTPGIYGLSKPIVISQSNFVVLGIGMPTLVATGGLSALVVESGATGVRVAQILVEAGTEISPDATEPLVFWRGDTGIASDLFARVGAFSYETDFHKRCVVTKADVMVRAEGDGLVFDNAWLWHADHDDCTESHRPVASDSAFSGNGLVVNGDRFLGYGLAVEHTKHDLVSWEGEDGALFFFQSELPYYSALDFGNDGYSGFKVGYGVQNFTGHGIGVYQVFNSYSMNASFRFPVTAKFYNMFTWCITGSRSGLGALGCHTPGMDHCTQGACNYNSCQLLQYPVPEDSCGDYCALSGCAWTEQYSCPWSPSPGSRGRAGVDKSMGYSCCCDKRTQEQQPCGGPPANNSSVESPPRTIELLVV